MAEDTNWQKDVLETIATEGLKEQKRTRRWGIFFKLLTFIYLFVLLAVFYPVTDISHGAIPGKKHTALVNLKGVIAPGSDASADKIITALRDAFEHKDTAGVILRINSPGGSPVQSGYIYDEILRLREKYPNTPMHAVITDICASGGYYVAAAAEKIYADQASIVGSVGVRMDNFGFVEAMKKLGVERRTLTAGENKALLDPFAPVDPKVNKHLQGLLTNVHNQFIFAIKQGRGDRLKEVEGMFSGLIWTGDQSVDIGLVDELASSSQVARDVIGAENIVDFTLEGDFFERFSKALSTQMADILLEKTVLPQLR
ncbi:MAG: S49 family peptidase [Gammaproteobacteria bacterium]|nr:S49 family peptidase [Gammaproteobacteria bacterium]MCW8911537.1 S49 family peptidase [Gammaproteobacteria bacterium]MCW9005111.1 S49 family peptidase [Gammaproteobacteria bacterium]MCW9055935.1 S49 family peptidase [Gammaproteobacteria bacterium]